MHEPFKHLWEISEKREEFYQQLDKLLDMASERKNKSIFFSAVILMQKVYLGIIYASLEGCNKVYSNNRKKNGHQKNNLRAKKMENSHYSATRKGKWKVILNPEYHN